MTVERTCSTTILAHIYDGGEIPMHCPAIHDGDLYLYGGRAGRVLAVEYGPNHYLIRYLTAEKAPR
jgi:hypothetical protein